MHSFDPSNFDQFQWNSARHKAQVCGLPTDNAQIKLVWKDVQKTGNNFQVRLP